jgi:hypothetical protein
MHQPCTGESKSDTALQQALESNVKGGNSYKTKLPRLGWAQEDGPSACNGVGKSNQLGKLKPLRDTTKKTTSATMSLHSSTPDM